MSNDERPDDSDSPSDSDNPTVIPPVNTNYVAIGAWYLSEIDLTDKQKAIIDTYKNRKPEAMVGNSIFVFRRY